MITSQLVNQTQSQEGAVQGSNVMIRISPTATKATHARLCVIDTALVSRKASDSRENRRHREIHTFHEGNDDALQRMLNAIQPSSYIRPHRHIIPPKAECLLLLQGS